MYVEDVKSKLWVMYEEFLCTEFALKLFLLAIQPFKLIYFSLIKLKFIIDCLLLWISSVRLFFIE